jgi:putative ABC transport system permease protein
VKFLPLLLANLGRKKARTLLTTGSFAVALFLFGLLVAIRVAFSAGIDLAGADRLMVLNRVSIIQPLPLAYQERLERVAGVASVTYASWFGGVYQNERNFFPQFGIDVDTYPQMYDEFIIPPDQLAAFKADRAGCIVGAKTARRFGWEVGQRIPLRGSIYPGDWQFNLRGIYRGSRPADDETHFWFHAKYLDEYLAARREAEFWRGYVGWYVVRIEDPDQAPQVAERIDATFANSAWETRTQTEKALNASFLKQMGNIELLILSIGAVVFFTLLLVTGNTMASSVRERVPELAVLKAIGYSDLGVLALVLAEAITIAAVGGGLGLVAAKLLSYHGDPTGGLLSVFYMPNLWLALGFFLALAVGFAAGLVPALTAKRLSVIDALRQV